MSKWDLIIFKDDNHQEVENRFKLSDKKLAAEGQHGKATIFIDEHGKEWLLKIFSKLIDYETKEILNLDVDIKDSPEKSRERLHLWRLLNEITASRLGRQLHLNIPRNYLLGSGKISSFPLKPATSLNMGDVIILDEEEGKADTADEFYEFTMRESGSIKTSKSYEDLLASRSSKGNSEDVLAILQEKIENSKNLDEFLDTHKGGFDSAFEEIRLLNDGYLLLPFDIWLNDPDRNAGNYLVQLDTEGKASRIWGIDYEMWSFGSDIWMEEDEITQGRSYLTAIIHPESHIFDSRVNETFYRIRMVQDEDIQRMTKAPILMCKFFEYHANQGNINPDERIVLKQVEENLDDFLLESRPRSDKLSEIITKQIGLPKDFEL
ncbi:MAG: hypothetical protein ACXACP_04345 [Candidatus Hodarchaeales archaeon]|jgi:hypothetical protein